jgi:hypothetical protein
MPKSIQTTKGDIMSINGATPIIGGTYVAPSGGSADALSAVGDATKMVARFDADTEYLTSKSVDFSSREPSVSSSAPNGYTQARRSALFKFPLPLDNGGRTVNTIKIELGVDVEATAAEIAEYCLVASQFLADPDFASFWQLGINE